MACANPNALDICPTQEELTPKLLELLPRGRAWGEGGPGREQGGVLYQFWWAVAGVYAALHAAICQLALEFFCQTQTLTTAIWLEEYGLPDGCDPFPDLCAKVAAFGGVTCAFYQEIALAIGWSISCGMECSDPLGTLFLMGSTPLGAISNAATLIVAVDLANSPAFTGVQAVGLVMGLYHMGLPAGCGADLTSLDCTLKRIVGAHINIVYVVTS